MLSFEQGVSARVPDALMADMYRDRKRVFIDLLGWDLPTLDDKYEIDQFDGPNTIYLIVGRPDGTHLGSMRLLPTNRPTIIGDFFHHLCDVGAPRSPAVWELSRLCLSPRIRAAERRGVRNRLLTSAVQFALQNTISAFCCVTHAWYMPEVMAYGWQCKAMGLPQMDPGGMVGALEIAINEETPLLMAQAGTWDETPVQTSFDPALRRGDVQ
ncbi:acyl-homoserine lactone synthase [Sphingobium sp. AP50]|uniref:acyl-homoserine-lactone synthase n=1 Tax=Sphingobium sp. AP50 TaxID=1884369 RepID=UPI0008CEFFE8|nr:acyl-homoserine-lactone synthase [Sphingobium sp. AP50]SEJ92028.1 acyl-homoserine lactone synthase [Sphingobium sp. AP50]